jgi:hypothetical protein
MSSNFLTVAELIAVLTAYCAAFCPILCWVIRGSEPVEKTMAVRALDVSSQLQN